MPRTHSSPSRVSYAVVLALPIAIGIAVTRYRLYEIDRLISRTIGWALVTGVLVAVFARHGRGPPGHPRPVIQGETLAVAASTLVAFALFQPVRRRVQTAVDHRFDRARYDGERTAAAFAERLPRSGRPRGPRSRHRRDRRFGAPSEIGRHLDPRPGRGGAA